MAKQFQINDRLSFREFLGLESGDKVPDQKTIWDFQNRLIKKKLDEKLFDHFHKCLDDRGLFFNEGKIVDASFVEVPRQHNTKEENEKIKTGKGNELWNDNPHKKCQKDIDARWTKKGEQKYYGYKDHAKIDAKSKLIDTYEVTSAEVHDSQPVKKLLREQDKGQPFFADSAYTGKTITNLLRRFRMKPRIIDRSYRNKPLTEKQKKKNNTKSKTRCRCEHVFGYVTNSMGDFFVNKRFLPRVVFQNIILSSAKWTFSISDIPAQTDESFDDYYSKIIEWQSDNKLPDLVQIVENDNKLLVDFKQKELVKILIKHINTKKLVVLEEFLFQSNENQLVKRGNDYFTNELIVCMHKNRTP